jgi:hypothetical protein
MNQHSDYPNTESANDDIDLTGFDDDYAQAEVAPREFDQVPDGRFQVAVDRIELVRAQSSGNPMLKWTLRILGPQHAGRLLWRNNLLVTRENIKWLKQDLETAGLKLDRVSDLRARLGELLDRKLEVIKRTKGDYTNIYINRRIVTDDAANTAPVFDDRDDIGF